MLHKALQNKWARVLIAVFATFLYALGVNLFVVPMGLYSGGVVGLSQIIRTLLAQAVELPAGVDIAGILYFLINIPVLYLAWRDLGRAFLIRTLICVGASSLFLSGRIHAHTRGAPHPRRQHRQPLHGPDPPQDGARDAGVRVGAARADNRRGGEKQARTGNRRGGEMQARCGQQARMFGRSE